MDINILTNLLNIAESQFLKRREQEKGVLILNFSVHIKITILH